MNLDRVIKELRFELAEMDRAIESLEGLIRITDGSPRGGRRRSWNKSRRADSGRPDVLGSAPEEYAGAD